MAPKISAEYGIIKRNNSYEPPSEIYAEGDNVIIQDDWGKHYRGTIIYIDDSVLELQKSAPQKIIKSFAVEAIKDITRM